VESHAAAWSADCCQCCEIEAHATLLQPTLCLQERREDESGPLNLLPTHYNLARMTAYDPLSAMVPKITASISLLSSFFPASPLIPFAPFLPPFAQVIL
jgi:hypothetical protein